MTATRYAVLALFLVLTNLSLAETRFPQWYGDHMVLQRDMAAPVWGWDDPGAEVTVTFAGQTKKATAGEDGKWLVKLDPMKANATGQELSATGTSTKTLTDVLVGEVWVCSGQSNMAWSVSRSIPGGATDEHPVKQAIAAADKPLVRMVSIGGTTAPDGPNDDVRGSWVVATPTTVNNFSAVGYFFGVNVSDTLDVPVGLIRSAWGGTPAEAWTSQETLSQDPRIGTYIETWEKRAEEWDEEKAKAAYEKQLAAWQEKADAAKEAGKKPPRKPRPSSSPLTSPHYPTTLYNGMIAPLQPYAIRGAIWYQGESNAGRAWRYQTLFSRMITDWRQNWGQGDFPFGYVELAQFTAPIDEPKEQNWAELREAQLMALQLPNVGVASAIDIGEAKDIHPKNKLDVGNRLALWARATVYGEDVAYAGPKYKGMAVEGSSIRISFSDTGSGLMAADKDGFAPVVPTPDAALGHFQIAGADQNWVWADAKIDGDTVVVSSEQVAEPVAVRYAWANNPDSANLYNKDGLPAHPFRTDDWTISTQPGFEKK